MMHMPAASSYTYMVSPQNAALSAACNQDEGVHCKPNCCACSTCQTQSVSHVPLRSTHETLTASFDRDMPTSPRSDQWVAPVTLTYLHGGHPLQCLPMRSLGALQGQL